MANKTQNPQDFIVPLNMNGMQGRMLHIPGPKNSKREVLFIYGHHSSLERWFGVVQNISKSAGVTMPDLPGFGGMESFYKIGKEASMDNFADYLAAFIKMRYKRRKVVIVGMSLGFAMVTRMLQRYPDLAKNVDMLVSYVGFTHKDEFLFSPLRHKAYLAMSKVFALPGFAWFFRYVILHPLILRHVYKRTHNAKEKFAGYVDEELEEITKFEIYLWHSNDVRTYMRTTNEFLKLDNTKIPIPMPVYHIAVVNDRFFSNEKVEQHLRSIFREYHPLATLAIGNHAPSVIADAKAAAPFIPAKLHRILKK